MYRLALPLQQQYKPPALCSTAIGPASNSVSDANLNQQHTQLFAFDRAHDCICNLGTSSGRQDARSQNAAMNDITAVTWLPTIKQSDLTVAAASTSAAPAASAAAAAAKKPLDAWALAVMPNGSVKAVCPTAGGATAPQADLLDALPEAEIPKNSGGSKLFSTTANNIVAFTTPFGLSGAPHVVAPTPPAAAAAKMPVPRGRGTAHLTAAASNAPGAAAAASSSAAGGAATAAAAAATGAGVDTAKHHVYAKRASMMSAVCYRGDTLHALQLDCPTEAVDARAGATALKLVSAHSLGKGTAPPEKVFSSIESVSLIHEKLPDARSSNNNKSSSSSFAGRHVLIVHLRGKGMSVSSSGNGGGGGSVDKVSALCVFDLVRKGSDLLTVEKASSVISAVARTPWTVVADRFQPPPGAAAGLDISRLSPVFSVAILGHNQHKQQQQQQQAGAVADDSSTSVVDEIFLALAHSGLPAMLSTASVRLCSVSDTLAPVRPIAFAGAECGEQPLTLNSKHLVSQMVTLRVAPSLTLVAVLTKDNVTQIFCAATAGSAGGSQQSSSKAVAESSARRRVREGEEPQTQNAGDTSRNSSGNGNNVVVTPSVWNLYGAGGGDGASSESNWNLFVGTTNNKSSNSNNNNSRVFLTMLTTVAVQTATLNTPVDEINLVMCTVAGRHVPLLLVTLGNGVLQSFPLLNHVEPRLLRTEAISVALPKFADYASVGTTISPPAAMLSSGSEGGPSKHLVAIVFGNYCVFLRSKKVA